MVVTDGGDDLTEYNEEHNYSTGSSTGPLAKGFFSVGYCSVKKGAFQLTINFDGSCLSNAVQCFWRWSEDPRHHYVCYHLI
jgi:hypothetical protein